MRLMIMWGCGFGVSCRADQTPLLRCSRRFLCAGSRQPEKSPPAPGGAGDRACDRREAAEGHAFPVKAPARDRNRVAFPAVLANKHGAGLEWQARRLDLTGKSLEKSQAVAVKAAERPF